MNETFPERLKRHRLAAGLTQQQLADLVGKSRPWITQLETGVRWEGKLPPGDDLRLLARALRLPWASLAGDDDGDDWPAPARIAEDRAWYETATDDELMDRSGIFLAPGDLAKSVADFEEITLHGDQIGSAIPHDIEDSYPRQQRRRRASKAPERYVRVVGDCMHPDIRNGDLVHVARDRHVRDGDLVAAIIYGEQAVVRKLAVRNGRQWLETLDGNAPLLVTEGIRIVGRIGFIQRTYI